MAPHKSSSSPKNRISPSLKQSTLGFTVSKRAASVGSAHPARGKGRPIARRTLSVAESIIPEVVHVHDTCSESEAEADIDSGVASEDESSDVSAAKAVSRRKGKGKGRVADSVEDEPAPKRKRLRKDVFGSRDSVENAHSAQASRTGKGKDVKDKQEDKPGLSEGIARWRKHYGMVRQRMGNLEPVHGEGQTVIDHILRVFDLSYEYGPCVGITRLERWERAQALGLKPLLRCVKEILMTKEGSEDERYSQCVFYGEV